MIFNYISSLYFSIMLNGCSRGFFKNSRRLRQSDPLSSYLFILSDLEVLSCMLNREFAVGRIKPFNSCGGSNISHLLYADDLLIFLNGRKASIRRLLEVIQVYENMLG